MKLHNTLSGKLETLVPLTPGVVKLYTCGLTVYSQPHIGNWLGYIYWDVLVRTLQADGLRVERTQNITDVGHLVSDDDSGEDKMEKGAKREGITAWDVAKKYSDIAEHEAYELLGLIRPDHLTPATSCIDQQIEFAKQLDEKGYLYQIDTDGMYFDTSKLTDYGKLAKLDIAGLEAGARVSVEGKKNPTDFAVWKFSPADAKRDMEWDSPWGKGFPGWHLECSVITQQTLGDQIDIHTGGIDHIPVHHTNEIAQTESITGKQFSQVWLHNNHIKVDGTKISKSLGNVYTLDDIQAKGFSIHAFKLLALSKHYRTEGNFTWDILEAAQNRLNNWRAVSALRWQVNDNGKNVSVEAASFRKSLLDSLQDDLNTPEALMHIDEALSEFDEVITPASATILQELLDTITELLGIDLNEVKDISAEAKNLIREGEIARAEKNWEASDSLRDQIETMGITVLDTVHG
ncbi:MAG TPA: cysteine--tRNA ligase, partial [Candidatus Saccharibacteria bacterium]|nr:cysteine--tRNA ligase [Candidatus Saccharibacteria bacterium]